MKAPLLAPLAAVGLLALLPLAGCVTLLPKQKPVNLYRFSYDPVALGKDNGARPAPPAAAVIPVALNIVMFPQASSGDRVLTSENNELSYVADSRWAVPARCCLPKR